MARLSDQMEMRNQYEMFSQSGISVQMINVEGTAKSMPNNFENTVKSMRNLPDLYISHLWSSISRGPQAAIGGGILVWRTPRECCARFWGRQPLNMRKMQYIYIYIYSVMIVWIARHSLALQFTLTCHPTVLWMVDVHAAHNFCWHRPRSSVRRFAA